MIDLYIDIVGNSVSIDIGLGIPPIAKGWPSLGAAVPHRVTPGAKRRRHTTPRLPRTNSEFNTREMVME